MANSTDFPGNQQHNEEWTNFPKGKNFSHMPLLSLLCPNIHEDLNSSPYRPYQATFDSTCEINSDSEELFLIRIVPGSVLPEQSTVEQNVTYGTSQEFDGFFYSLFLLTQPYRDVRR
jgi:hypothetical protein